ncbi:MAG: tetratricopeptide repeat protein [Vulcanimicrobiota bacterium]
MKETAVSLLLLASLLTGVHASGLPLRLLTGPAALASAGVAQQRAAYAQSAQLAEQALAAFEPSLKADRIRARQLLAISLYKQGLYKEARPHFESLLKANPKDEEARKMLAEIKKKTK